MANLIPVGVCASCKAEIFQGDAFCQTCGTAVVAQGDNGQTTSEKVVVYVEQPAAFASGLPEWSIEPPAIVVRRNVRI